MMAQWNLPLMEPKVAETFSVADRFRLIQVLELWIHETADPQKFSAEKRDFYAQVPFKAGSTVYYI